MRRAHRVSRSCAVAFVAFVLLPAVSPTALLGQARVPSVRPHIHLPASYGATPLSTIIHANAVLTAARGDFLESAANAGFTRALTAKQEMVNSVEWVRTYFQRREINLQYRRSKPYIERRRDKNKMDKSFIRSDYQVELETDPSDKLNFMLVELNVLALPERFYPDEPDTLVDSKIDQKLSPDDRHHIWLTDGGPGGERLVFRADEVPLETSWPWVLRAKKLEAPRHEVERARAAAVKLKATGELSYETGQDLRDKVNALVKAFEAEYPKERRLKTGEAFLEYLAGLRFLQSFATGVHRMIMSDDPRAFRGYFRFEGESVAGLVAHMHMSGLKFAPRQSGDESVYQTLFVTMRRFYERFDDASSG